MPGPLLSGYYKRIKLFEEEEEEERKEKRLKLQDQLDELNLQSMAQQMEMRAKDQDYQERVRATQEEERAKRAEWREGLTPEQEEVLRLGELGVPETEIRGVSEGYLTIPPYGEADFTRTAQPKTTTPEMPSIESLYKRADKLDEVMQPELAEQIRAKADSMLADQLDLTLPTREGEPEPEETGEWWGIPDFLKGLFGGEEEVTPAGDIDAQIEREKAEIQRILKELE